MLLHSSTQREDLTLRYNGESMPNILLSTLPVPTFARVPLLVADLVHVQKANRYLKH